MDNFIKIRGARQHNLKNVDLDLPKNKFIVFTGVSGSGKSSMAFDTIYAEGQRRYVESLSNYARQFLGIMEKPDVDSIEGLSPSISIDQKTTSKNPRSTVGTVTEIYDYLRLLFARIGHPHCPICSREIKSQSSDQIIDSMLNLIRDKFKYNSYVRFFLMARIIKDKKGEYSALFNNLKSKGFNDLRIDGQVRQLNEDLYLIKTNKHTVDVITDKYSITKKDLNNEIFYSNFLSRLKDSLNLSLNLSDGVVLLSFINDSGFELPKNPKYFEDHIFSEKYACPIDNIQIPEMEPREFSFNSPHGACVKCSGLGYVLEIDTSTIFSNELSIKEGGIMPLSNTFEYDSWFSRLFIKFCSKNNIDMKLPIKYLSKNKIDLILNGTGNKIYHVTGNNRFGNRTVIHEKYSGLVNILNNKFNNTSSDFIRDITLKYFKEIICPLCDGKRLKKESLNVTINNKSIFDVCVLSIDNILRYFNDLENNNILSSKENNISDLIIVEIKKRLNFLISVGLDYINLSRSAQSLSGGEAQRIRLASQIGSGLTGVLYVLDEPTIGLHQKDNEKLIKTLKNLRDMGNTIITVEHDEEVIRNADFVVDFGLMAGKKGGSIVEKGNVSNIINNDKSITGKYLSGNCVINYPHNKTLKNSYSLTINNCNRFNLKDITVNIPLNKFVVITGVSGSGKSTLLVDTLYPLLLNKVSKNKQLFSENTTNVSGFEYVDKVILIDQSPIGRTPRSNPSTYIKLFDDIRDIFSRTYDAKSMGFNKSQFSFNLKGGRCEACEGQGQTKIEMQFLNDIWVKCEVCQGKRYNSQTLEVSYKGKNISEILDMTVDEACEFFHNNNNVIRKLSTLNEIGLNYIALGQPATTLSGGEAQRIKLAHELSKKDTGRTVYILDEPTTGLHFFDINKLLLALKKLVNKGNSVLIIEHNMDIIKNADWIIDLGPDGGDKGGFLVAEGPISEIVKNKNSYTGIYLNKYLNNHK